MKSSPSVLRWDRLLMKLIVLSLVSLVSVTTWNQSFWAGVAVASMANTPEGFIRPTAAARDVQDRYNLPIPFYQAVPYSQGTLFPDQVTAGDGVVVDARGRGVIATASPAALWPDGSVRWLAVDGVWPANISLNGTSGEGGVPVYIGGSGDGGCDDSCQRLSPPIHGLDVRNNEVHLLDAVGNTVVVLKPEASYIQVNREKEILPLHVPDDIRQFAWAEPIEKLNANGSPVSMPMQIREYTVERKTDAFTVYRIRGDGGDGMPASRLEWQLRVRIYRGTPVVRLQMTWGIHWHPDLFALTEAKWVARFPSQFSDVHHGGLATPLNASAGEVVALFDPTGRGETRYFDDVVAETSQPVAEWNEWVAAIKNNHNSSNDYRYLGIGAPNANRLGPNHISVYGDQIELASWSGRQGYGLDLRHTAKGDEFGMSASDARDIAIGVTRTLEASLIWGGTDEEAAALAGLEAQRDTLWLPSRFDLVKTAALGPWREEAFREHERRLEGIAANIHFLIASRDYWRWNGWANFGDVRTNFAYGSNPDRGLFAGTWALYGRYGWRNGSAQPYLGMWTTGLALEDRDMAMAALDYALHVAEVDVSHPSFFRARLPFSGGMHRRNKDHWSGSIQTQYTPGTGLYLTKWLTGHERLEETLEAVRAYSSSNAGSSVFSASAWIHRYAETHDPEDLDRAKSLLDIASWGWSGRDSQTELSGLAVLYVNNFRRTLDGFPVLIEFYETTGDPAYLEAMATSIKAHGLPDSPSYDLSEYYGLAYLVANDIALDEDIQSLVEKAKNQIADILHPRDLPPREAWDYDQLRKFITGGLDPVGGATYRESTNIAGRGAKAPMVFSYLGCECSQSSDSSDDAPNEDTKIADAEVVKAARIYEVEGEEIFISEQIDDDLSGFVIIETIDDLQKIAHNPKGKYALGRDIDAFETKEWNGGEGFMPIPSFSGVFDGRGYVITGLTIRRLGMDSVGLFQEILPDGVVRAVGLADVIVWGRSTVGSLVGTNKGVVQSAYSTGSVMSEESRVAGLIGTNEGKVTNTFSSAVVRGGKGHVAGLIGWNSGEVKNSYSSADVTAASDYVGGLIAKNQRGGKVISSISIASVTGNRYVGGLVGDNEGGEVKRSYSGGSVTGTTTVGGLVGLNRTGGRVKWSHTGAAVQGTGVIGGLVGINRTDSEIVQSYSVGPVEPSGAKATVGGLVGRNEGTVTSSFWNVGTSGQEESADGVGITSMQMSDIDFWRSESGWESIIDFGNGSATESAAESGGDDEAVWRFYANDGAPLLKSILQAW